MTGWRAQAPDFSRGGEVRKLHLMREDERGVTGLIEILVAMVLGGILYVFVTFAVGSLLSDTATVTSESVATARLTSSLSKAVQQLSGAQPEPFCLNAPGGETTGWKIFSTPAATCSEPSQGPPVSATGSPTIWVPTAAKTACAPAGALATRGAPSSLLIATPRCVGFLSYDYERSVTKTTPLSFPYETLIWVATTNGLYVSQYRKLGTLTHSTCTGGKQPTYTNGCWKKTGVQTRFLGTVAGSRDVFTFLDQTATAVTPYSGSGAECIGTQTVAAETACSKQLASIVTADVKVTFAEGQARSARSTFQVPIYGSVYSNQAATALKT